MTILDAALEYHALGWQVVPAPHKGKMPLGKWRQWQTERITEHQVREFFTTDNNIFIICGAISGICVLDCDDEASLAWWGTRLGDVLEQTTRVKTGNGYHFYFKIPEGVTMRGRSQPEGSPSGKWDLRADGGGVVAPPSTHESGRVYSWVENHGPETIQEAPAELIERSNDESGSDGDDTPRSTLTHLLSNPPQGEGSGRNNWLTQVAGHYAKQFPFEDAYKWHVREAADKLVPPLPDAEVDKLIPSIWRAERESSSNTAEREKKIGERVALLEIDNEARSRIAAGQWEPPKVVIDLATALARPRPETRWAVEGLAAYDDNILLCAKYKMGKTTLLLNLLKALADGERFLGHFETFDGRKVAWLNFEMSEARAIDWLHALQFARPERVLPLTLRGERNPFASQAGTDWLIETLIEHAVTFLAVDTFRVAYPGTDHNSNAEVARFTAQLDYVKAQANVPGLVLSHHFGRKLHDPGEEHGQGAVELDAWADMRWNITADEHDNRFLWAGGRVDGIEESQLEYDPSTRRLALPENLVGVGREDSRQTAARALVMRALRSHPGTAYGELRDACTGKGAHVTDIAQAIREMKNDGSINVVTSGRTKLHFLPADVPGANQITLMDSQ